MNTGTSGARSKLVRPLSDPTGRQLPQILLAVLFIAIGWAVLIRPQQAALQAQRLRNQEHDDMVAALAPGQQVITAGGIHGTVTHVAEDNVRVEVARGIELTLARDAIHKRIDVPASEEQGVETPVTNDPSPATAPSEVQQ